MEKLSKFRKGKIVNMIIGIDIDDVITNTSETIEKYIENHENSKKIKQHMAEIMKATPSNAEVVQFCKQTLVKVFQETTLKQNAQEVISQLINEGNEIYLITARGDNLDFLKGSEKVTVQFFKDNKIKYTKIIFNAVSKVKICIDNKIDLMVDDSVTHCEEIANAGIKTILFTTEINKNINTKVERVDNWLQLLNKFN